MMKFVPETCMSVSPAEPFLASTVAFLWKSFDKMLTFFVSQDDLLLQLSSAKQAVVVRAKEAAITRVDFMMNLRSDYFV
jgi:hypothetical protein